MSWQDKFPSPMEAFLGLAFAKLGSSIGWKSLSRMYISQTEYCGMDEIWSSTRSDSDLCTCLGKNGTCSCLEMPSFLTFSKDNGASAV